MFFLNDMFALFAALMLCFPKDRPYCSAGGFFSLYTVGDIIHIIYISKIGLGKSAALYRTGTGNGSADHRHSWSTACDTASITSLKKTLRNTCAECRESWRVKI